MRHRMRRLAPAGRTIFTFSGGTDYHHTYDVGGRRRHPMYRTRPPPPRSKSAAHARYRLLDELTSSASPNVHLSPVLQFHTLTDAVAASPAGDRVPPGGTTRDSGFPRCHPWVPGPRAILTGNSSPLGVTTRDRGLGLAPVGTGWN